MSRWSERIRAALIPSLIAMIFFLWLAFRGVEFEEPLRTLRDLHYLYVLGALGFAVGGCVVRAFQWKVVLKAVKPVPALRLFRSLMVGFSFNFLLPVRVGEVLRGVITSREEDLPFATVLTTIMVTRVLDLLTLLGLWSSVLVFSGLFDEFSLPGPLLAALKAASYGMVGACLAGLMAVFLVRRYQEATQRELRRLRARFESGSGRSGRIVRKTVGWIENFLRGLKLLDDSRQIAAAIALSVIVWLLSATVVHLVLLAFDSALPFSASLFVMVVIALGIALPGAPGYIGQFHAACRYSLAPFGVAAAKATSIAVFLHAFHFSYTLVLGILSIISDRRIWRIIRGSADQASVWNGVGEPVDSRSD